VPGAPEATLIGCGDVSTPDPEVRVTTPDADAPRRRPLLRRRWFQVAAGATVLVAVAAGLFLWWFLADDAPPPVDLGRAVEGVTETTGDATGPTTASETTAVGGDISGEWFVDTTLGTFDFESATGSFAGFRVDEELSSIGASTAVGRTGAITGTIEIDGNTLVRAEIEVDLTQITTNQSRRDDRVQGALETAQFPTATFVLTEPVELPAGAAAGEAIVVAATGDLTIHGVTNTATLDLEAQLVDDVVVVVGSTDLVFSEYGVETPTAPIVVSVEDQGILELQLLFTKA
jgi:polyisoprenoid-binding protein YceI